MGKRSAGSVGLLELVLEELRRAAGSASLAQVVRERTTERTRRVAVDLVAIPLIAAIVMLTLSTEGRNVIGAPFMFAVPTWMVTRTRGLRAGALVATALVAVTWLAWYDTAILARVNVTLIMALALVAGVDGRRRGAAKAATEAGKARADERRSTLTRREHDVLALLATGHTNKEVAAQLGLSVRTIESHRARIVTKLGSSGRADLYRHAQELGLLEPERLVS